MSTRVSPTERTTHGRGFHTESLDQRLAILFWALLFILVGAIWLFPESRVPNGTWPLVSLTLIAIGASIIFELLSARRPHGTTTG